MKTASRSRLPVVAVPTVTRSASEWEAARHWEAALLLALRVTASGTPIKALAWAISLASVGWAGQPAPQPQASSPLLFCIGTPDGRAAEFGLTGPGEGYTAYLQKFPEPVEYAVGQSSPRHWPYIHPAPRDKWAGGRTHPFAIRFVTSEHQKQPLFLVLGLAGGSPSECSRVVVTVNETPLPAQTAPSGNPRVCFQPTAIGQPATMVFEIPAGTLGRGDNTLTIRLEDQSWIIYVDGNQMAFHHLWITSPDGLRQTVYYGNQHPGITMIDAKPIPGSRKIVASFSPGHGLREHDGTLTIVDPRNGPDELNSAQPVSSGPSCRDPWAFSENAYLAASDTQLVLLDGSGATQTIFELPTVDAQAGLQCHEPRPLVARPREAQLATHADGAQPTGRILVSNIYAGRNMAGVQPGEIKRLLVLETLPKPMNYTGGMEPLSYGGTFTLERILGTIPVEPDGSVYAELPALRSLFFVALDERNLSVKRMQSFLTVMPGETTGCVGCHEARTQTPPLGSDGLLALRRPPDRIAPIEDVPDVLDFPRDVQPILDAHCVRCHDEDRREGGLSLSGDRGPIFSISYYALTAKGLVVDGRNDLGNRPPRAIGSGASRLLRLMDGSHYEARPSARERRIVRLWIDSGAAYPGTYAALGTGMIGKFEIVDRSIRLDRSDTEWPGMKLAMEALQRRCTSCHQNEQALPLSPSHVTGTGGWGSAFTGAPPWVALTPNDIRRRYSRHLFYNLSRPDESLLLLAPRAKSAGGLEACGPAAFADTRDPDFQLILAAIRETKGKLDEIKRFDMAGFQPRAEYVREMQRFGILPADWPAGAPLDVYATDRQYWQSLW